MPASYTKPPSQGNHPPRPRYESGASPVAEPDWNKFNQALDDRPNISDEEIHAYQHIFAAEGGFKPNPTNHATAGIREGTLEAIQSRAAAGDLHAKTLMQQLGGTTDPIKLINQPDKIANVYKYWLDNDLKEIGGSAGLEKVGNKYAATALADTVFREGRAGGASIVREAIRKTDPVAWAAIDTDGKRIVGSTYRAYSLLAKNPATLGPLLDNLGETRKRARPGEDGRHDFFKFKKERSRGVDL